MFSEGKRLYDSGQMLLSAMHFSALRSSTCDLEIASHAWLGYALAMNALEESTEALHAADHGLAQAEVFDSDKAALRMLKTWIYKQPSSDLSETQKKRWQLWTERFDRRRFLATLNEFTSPAIEKSKISDIELKLISAPHKSVWGSSLASAVIPGAGQAYVGNWQAAGLSFVINAIFLGAFLEFSRNGQSAAAVASGGVFSITYIGNILSAAQSANESNKLAQAPEEAQIKNSTLPELSF